MGPSEFARFVDHTVLQPNTTDEDVRRACREAIDHDFFAVCLAPSWVPLAAELTAATRTTVCTVIGFPHGSTLPDAKRHEAFAAIAAGARELDMVINIGALLSGDVALVTKDIAGVVAEAAAAEADVRVKVILETGFLSDAQKAAGCRAAVEAGADFVKTSTGFGPSGASVEDVRLLRRVVGKQLGIKAAGGIRSAGKALAMIEAGATRLGCSRSVDLVKELGPEQDGTGRSPDRITP